MAWVMTRSFDLTVTERPRQWYLQFVPLQRPHESLNIMTGGGIGDPRCDALSCFVKVVLPNCVCVCVSYPITANGRSRPKISSACCISLEMVNYCDTGLCRSVIQVRGQSVMHLCDMHLHFSCIEYEKQNYRFVPS